MIEHLFVGVKLSLSVDWTTEWLLADQLAFLSVRLALPRVTPRAAHAGGATEPGSAVEVCPGAIRPVPAHRQAVRDALVRSSPVSDGDPAS